MNKGDILYCVFNIFGFALTVTVTQNGAKILHQIENSQDLQEDRCFYFTTICLTRLGRDVNKIFRILYVLFESHRAVVTLCRAVILEMLDVDSSLDFGIPPLLVFQKYTIWQTDF